MKIALLGDSIRIQYENRVRELLGEDFGVYGPKENCRFAKYTLRGLFDWRKDMEGSRIVHWNNGLWDICDLFGDGLFSSEEEYVDNIVRIADILKSRHEVVIFATMTPVSDKNIYNKNSDIERYNNLVIPKLRERGIIINDLYSLINSDRDRYISEDNMIINPISFPAFVPDGCIFVLGDNRNESLDSRSADIGEYGMVDTRYVLGKAVLRIFPFNKLRWL